MKTLLICSLWLGLAVQAVAGPPTTFEEFKQLPPAQRDALMADALSKVYDDPPNLKLKDWWVRQHMSEKEWQWDQQRRLIDHNDYYGLSNFFNEYQSLRQSCLMHEAAALKAKGLPPSELAEALTRLGKLGEGDSDIYVNIVPLLASVAPGAEAKALNERAQQMVSGLYDRYPTGAITRQAVTELDKRAQEMLEQVKKLPKLTAEQEQAAIDALPPSGQLPLGIHYPYK